MPVNKTASAPISRRRFVAAGAAAGAAMATACTADAAAVVGTRARSCIFLFLTGGPSHLDTWDPKPDAPAEVRGPFGSIATRVPGIRIGELFPRMAAVAHRFAIVRSVHHSAAAVHETGMQLLQTGRLSRPGSAQPHVGAVIASRPAAGRSAAPAFALVPRPIADTGMNVYHGQGSGWLGAAHAPAFDATTGLPAGGDADRYGRAVFGGQCLRARRLVEAGSRCVVVNMFDSLTDGPTWDCHADNRLLRSTLADYRRTLCPTFDQAYAALLEDLHNHGMLASTLVVAAGEFGRTPQLNAHGGRDHWPGVWSVLFAGGGVRGGQVIGMSDKHGAAPARRPVHAADVAATIYAAFGIDPSLHLSGPRGEKMPLTDGRPIGELFV